MSNVVPILAASPNPTDRLLARPNREHLVQFYEDDEDLIDTLEHFLGAGLASGEPIVVIATEEHRRRLVHRLGSPKVEAAVGSGRALLLDARETLARFLVNGMPDPHRFHRMIDDLMTQVTGGRPARVRAFGEMVDLLWRDGARTAAICLEELWNEAAAVHSFSLLCAYVMATFVKGASDPDRAAVCRSHTHVLSAASLDALAKADPAFELGRLRERCRLLETENQRPARAVAPARAPGTEASATTQSVKRRVLVADDNVDFVELFQAAIEDWGHEVRVAYDGPQALLVCEEFEPEIVFLDIGLPGMDGYEVARRMRKMARGDRMRIVAVSGYTRETDRVMASSSGFSDYFAKPLDLHCVARLLEAPVHGQF
jgi:CheY-like chemotaxis protein